MPTPIPVWMGVVDEECKLRLESRELFTTYLRRLKGQPVQLVLKKMSRRKSSNQLGYLFGLVYPVIADDLGYREYEVTEVRRVSSGAKPQELRFCSKECSHAYFKGERHPCYRGVTDPNRGRAWAHRAESIRVRDGRCCRRCGKPESENGGRRRLHVDHLIPWRAFSNKNDANDPSNLAALCMACHGFKTTTVEKRYLRGDVLGLKQFIESLHLPSAQFNS